MNMSAIGREEDCRQANRLSLRLLHKGKNVPVLKVPVMAGLVEFWALSGSRGGCFSKYFFQKSRLKIFFTSFPFIHLRSQWRVGRAVDCGSLENC
nr:hypothetical protein [uncultured Chitinophaga sp.]